MGLGSWDLPGEQNQGLEESWKRVKLPSSVPLGSPTSLAQNAEQGSDSGHVLVLAQGFVAPPCSPLQCQSWGRGGGKRLWMPPKGLNDVFCVGPCSLGHGRGVSADAGAGKLQPRQQNSSRNVARRLRGEMQAAWSPLCTKNLYPLYNWGKANKETCLQVGTWCHWEKSPSKSEPADLLPGLLTLRQKGDAFTAKFSDKRLLDIPEELCAWVA